MPGKLKSFKIIGATAAQPHRFLNITWNKLMGSYTDTKWNYIGKIQDGIIHTSTRQIG